jgi:hypothetical protein
MYFSANSLKYQLLRWAIYLPPTLNHTPSPDPRPLGVLINVQVMLKNWNAFPYIIHAAAGIM